MSREKISFEPNIPQQVALEFKEGKSTPGQFGEQCYYSLTGNRCMYVPPFVAHEITRLDFEPGEIFEICKTVRKEGGRNTTRWIVGFVDQGNPGSPHGELAVPNRPERPKPQAQAPTP